MFALVDETAAGSFDYDSNLSTAKQKTQPSGWVFCLAKDCDYNKMGVIVEFYYPSTRKPTRRNQDIDR